MSDFRLFEKCGIFSMRAVIYVRRRQPNGALEFVIFLMLAIPVGAYYLLKWVIGGIAALNSYTANPENIKARIPKVSASDMVEVDRLDGVSFENFVAGLLAGAGYDGVETTKASGDYGVDIVAARGGEKYVFQCKCYASNLGVKPVQEIYSGAGMYHADVAVVVTNAHFTQNAITLADELGVLLWDREKLMDMIGHAKSECKQESIVAPSNITQTTRAYQEGKDIPKQVLSMEKMEDDTMATTIGAGKYVFGENISLGRYDLIAVSGVGMLKLEKLSDGEWDEEWINFGVENYCAKTYYGLSLPEGRYFEVTGNVSFEISKAKMIEID